MLKKFYTDGDFQSKSKLRRLFNDHVSSNNSRKGGGAFIVSQLPYNGFYYLDEIQEEGPPLNKRGSVIFVLLPTIDRDSGHWVVITRKSRQIKYYDPAINKSSMMQNSQSFDITLPNEIKSYLDKISNEQGIPYTYNKIGYQDLVLKDSNCGIYCIEFLKSEYKS